MLILIFNSTAYCHAHSFIPYILYFVLYILFFIHFILCILPLCCILQYLHCPWSGPVSHFTAGYTDRLDRPPRWQHTDRPKALPRKLAGGGWGAFGKNEHVIQPGAWKKINAFKHATQDRQGGHSLWGGTDTCWATYKCQCKEREKSKTQQHDGEVGCKGQSDLWSNSEPNFSSGKSDSDITTSNTLKR